MALPGASWVLFGVSLGPLGTSLGALGNLAGNKNGLFASSCLLLSWEVLGKVPQFISRGCAPPARSQARTKRNDNDALGLLCRMVIILAPWFFRRFPPNSGEWPSKSVSPDLGGNASAGGVESVLWRLMDS